MLTRCLVANHKTITASNTEATAQTILAIEFLGEVIADLQSATRATGLRNTRLNTKNKMLQTAKGAGKPLKVAKNIDISLSKAKELETSLEEGIKLL